MASKHMCDYMEGRIDSTEYLRRAKDEDHLVVRGVRGQTVWTPPSSSVGWFRRILRRVARG